MKHLKKFSAASAFAIAVSALLALTMFAAPYAEASVRLLSEQTMSSRTIASKVVRASYITSAQSGAAATTTFSFPSQSLGPQFGTRLIVIGVVGRHPGVGGVLTSATIGGVSATIVKTQTNSTSGNTSSIAIISALVPTGDTGTVALTFSTNCNNPIIAIYALTGNGNPTAVTSTSAGTNTSTLSGTLTVPKDGVAFGFAYNGTGGNVSAFSNIALENNTASFGVGHTSYHNSRIGLAVSATFTAAPSDTVAAFASWGP